MGKRVLVVEDVEDTRDLMRVLIEGYGYAVVEAPGPYEAIEKATQYQPDLILMDIGLPLMDGLTAAELIGGIDSLKHIPIVVVTAYHDVRARALRAGCTGVLYKPVDPPELKQVLERHLEPPSPINQIAV
jgi:CheY-like chemotaxis protein